MPKKRIQVWRMFAGKNHSQWKYWLNQGVMSIGWGTKTGVGCPEEYMKLSELEDVFEEYFSSLRRSRLAARNLWWFSKTARVGDYICVYDESSLLGIGKIEGLCEYIDDDVLYDNDELYAYRRDVEWYSTTRHKLSTTMKDAVFKRYEGSICRVVDEVAAKTIIEWAQLDLESAESLDESVDEIDEEEEDSKDVVYHIARISRAKRNRQKAGKFAHLNNRTCQVCGKTIELPDGRRLIEVHHIKPLGKLHRGKDLMSNMICLCPNHHAEMDRGAFYISSKTKKVVHFDKRSSINGNTITSTRDVWPATHNLKYQRDNICNDWVS